MYWVLFLMSVFLDRFDNFPSVIQGFGIALLAVLIPFAIAILQDIYHKRKEPEAEFAALDLHVVLDHVFRIKRLLLCLGFIFLPMLFWHISAGLFRWLLLAVSLIAIASILQSLLKIYRWVKGNIFPFRFRYLPNLKDREDLPVVWRSVWQAKDIGLDNEIRLFQIFSSTVNRLLGPKKENLKIVYGLLDDFRNFLHNRSTSLLAIRKEGLPTVLGWRFRIWHDEQLYLSNDEKLDDWSRCEEIGRTLDSMILTIEDRALKGKGIESFSLFRYLKNDMDCHREDYVTVNNSKRYYAEGFLSNFYRVFFESVADSPSRRQIWIRYFPQEWKVTRDNLKQSNLANVSWYQFRSWAEDRIWPPREKPDKSLDDVVANLFPEVEPRVWSRMLILAFSPDDQNKVQSAMKHHWNFGDSYSRRSKHKGYARDQGEDDKAFFRRIAHAKHDQQEKETKRTFELACLLFPDEFSQEIAQKYKKELEGIKCVEGSIGERHRSELLDIFSQMLEFFHQQSLDSGTDGA